MTGNWKDFIEVMLRK
ncbi:protein YpfM [Citrobacter freundii]|nr:protein YpfM [Citrobacter sp. RHBSTW-00524]